MTVERSKANEKARKDKKNEKIVDREYLKFTHTSIPTMLNENEYN